MVYCQKTVVMAIWACSGYDTESLLIALTQHTNIYGSPDIVVSDQGSQMVAAANESIN